MPGRRRKEDAVQVLVHIEEDVEGVLFCPGDLLVRLLQVFLIEDAGLRFEAIPDHAQAQAVEAPPAEITELGRVFRADITHLWIFIDQVDAMQDDVPAVRVNETIFFCN